MLFLHNIMWMYGTETAVNEHIISTTGKTDYNKTLELCNGILSLHCFAKGRNGVLREGYKTI